MTNGGGPAGDGAASASADALAATIDSITGPVAGDDGGASPIAVAVPAGPAIPTAPAG